MQKVRFTLWTIKISPDDEVFFKTLHEVFEANLEQPISEPEISYFDDKNNLEMMHRWVSLHYEFW